MFNIKSCSRCSSCSTHVTAGEGTLPRCSRGPVFEALMAELGFYQAGESGSWLLLTEPIVEPACEVEAVPDDDVDYLSEIDPDVWGAWQDYFDSRLKTLDKPTRTFISVKAVTEAVCEKIAGRCRWYSEVEDDGEMCGIPFWTHYSEELPVEEVVVVVEFEDLIGDNDEAETPLDLDSLPQDNLPEKDIPRMTKLEGEDEFPLPRVA